MIKKTGRKLLKNFYYLDILQIWIISALILIIIGWILMLSHSSLFIAWYIFVLLFCFNCWKSRKEIKEKICELFSENAKQNMIYSVCTTFVFIFVAHGFLFTNEFFSHDSVSNTFYSASSPQFYLSVGRFIIPLYETMKGPYSAPWLIGLFFTIWMSLVCFLVVELFQFKSKYTIIITSGILCTNTTLAFTGATYIYCLDEYALALLGAVVAAYCFSKWEKGAIVGICFLIFSLSMYQAYFTVALALCFIFTVQKIIEHKEIKKTILYGIRQIGLLLCSFGVYFLIWTLLCKNFRIEKFRSTEETIFGKGLLAFFNMLADTYINYFQRLFDISGLLGKAYATFNFLLLILFFYILFQFLLEEKISISKKMILIFTALCIPIVFMSSKIILAGNTSELVGYAYELIYIFYLVWIEKYGLKEQAKKIIVCFFANSLICCIIYGNILMSNQAYIKKDLEKTATISLVTRIIDRIETLEGYFPNDTWVYIVGDLRYSDVNNGKMDVSYLETKTGLWYNQSATYNLVWYITDYMNYPMQITTGSDLADIEEIQKMPCFPAIGSVKMIGEIAVVKLS